MRTALLASAALVLAAFALPAAGAAPVCVPKSLSLACVTLTGACVVVSSSPGPDAGVGAGACPSLGVGPDGVSACADAGAAYMTIAGPRGVLAHACVTDVTGAACVSVHVEAFDATSVVPPLCLA